MSGTETLTVPAHEVRLGDRWHDAEEKVDVVCFDAPRSDSHRPDIVRVYVQTVEEPGVKGTQRMRLLYGSDEMLTVTRALPPTDEEHEAALRALVSDGARRVVGAVEVAAVLRLLDAERAKVAGVTDALVKHDDGLIGQATALGYVRTALGRKP